MVRRTAGVLVIGNEILGGHTQDTNSHWLANRLRELGIELKRISVVGDTVEEIVHELRHFRDQVRIHELFVCGGLGPTPDDKTLEGVAAAFDAPLQSNPDVLARLRKVAAKMHELGLIESAQGGRGVEKMAELPSGSTPLANFAGMAPGVLLEVPREEGTMRVFVLPGVPREMKAIFDEVVAPVHLKGLGEVWHTETVKHEGEESELFPLLDRLEREMPSVVIGSYPKFGKLEVTLRVSGTKEDVTRAVAEIRAFLEERQRRLAR